MLSPCVLFRVDGSLCRLQISGHHMEPCMFLQISQRAPTPQKLRARVCLFACVLARCGAHLRAPKDSACPTGEDGGSAAPSSSVQSHCTPQSSFSLTRLDGGRLKVEEAKTALCARTFVHVRAPFHYARRSHTCPRASDITIACTCACVSAYVRACTVWCEPVVRWGPLPVLLARLALPDTPLPSRP